MKYELSQQSFFRLFINDFKNKKEAMFLSAIIPYFIISFPIFLNLILRGFNFSQNINLLSNLEAGFAFAFVILMASMVSGAFSEIFDKKLNIFYFTLPGSIEEKYLSKLAFTFILPIIINFIILFLFSGLYSLIMLLAGAEVSIASLNLKTIISNHLISFIFYHSIFFYFSTIWINNSFISFLKTVLVLIGISILLMIIFGMINLLILQNTIYENFVGSNAELFQQYYEKFIENKKIFKGIFYTIKWIIPFLLYYLGYKKIKTKKLV